MFLRRLWCEFDVRSGSCKDGGGLCIALLCCFGQGEQLVEIVRLEEPPLLWIFQHSVDEELFVDLPMVDLLLNGAGGHQPVDGHLVLLPDPPRPLPRLHVRARVPVRVEDNDSVGSGQVHAKPTNLGCQEEDERVASVKLLNQPLTRSDGCGPVQL